jgi:hypothetical protein
MTVPVGDVVYVKTNASTQQWYDSNFISAFAVLVTHCAHNNDEQCQLDLPQLLHVTYPKYKLHLIDCKKLPMNAT